MSLHPYMAYLGVYGAFVLFSLLILFLRRNHEPVKSRTPSLLVPSAVYGVIAVGLTGSFSEASLVGNFDPEAICSQANWNSILFLPLWLLPFFMRASILYFRHRWNAEKVEQAGKPMSRAASMSFATNNDEIPANNSFILPNSSSGMNIVGLDGTPNPAPSAEAAEEGSEAQSLLSVEKKGARYQLFTSAKFNFAVVTLIMALDVALGAALYYANPMPYAAEISQAANCLGWILYLLIIQAVLVVAGLIVVVVKLWKVTDAYHIKHEFNVYAVALPIFIVIYFIVASVPSLLEGQLPMVYVSIFLLIGFSIYYPVALSFTQQYRQRQEADPESGIAEMYTQGPDGTLSSGKDSLIRSVMNNSASAKEFVDYCTRLWCVENILFFKAVEEFETLVAAGAKEKRLRAKAKQICTHYLTVGSLSEINVDVDCREKVLEALQQGNLTAGIFVEAKTQVVWMLQNDVMPKWRRERDLIAKRKEAKGTEEARKESVSSSTKEGKGSESSD